MTKSVCLGRGREQTFSLNNHLFIKMITLVKFRAVIETIAGRVHVDSSMIQLFQ